jgi:hypothetical protein
LVFRAHTAPNHALEPTPNSFRSYVAPAIGRGSPPALGIEANQHNYNSEGGNTTKLTISRNQADVKGFFGGHKGVSFRLFGKADITDAEKALITKYKVGDYALANYELRVKGSSEKIPFIMTVNDIINGKSVETDSINTLLELEEAIKTGCVNLKNLLQVMSTFGGQEVFDI